MRNPPKTTPETLGYVVACTLTVVSGHYWPAETVVFLLYAIWMEVK